jgi:hypothetical protein
VAETVIDRLELIEIKKQYRNEMLGALGVNEGLSLYIKEKSAVGQARQNIMVGQIMVSWAEQTYSNLVYWNEVECGGHFAAFEQPKLFARELRAGFRPMRR